MAFPNSKDTFQRAAQLVTATSLGAIPLASWMEKVGLTLEGLQDRAGTDATTDEASLILRLARAEAVTAVNVEKYGIRPGAGLGAINSYILAVLLGDANFFAGDPVDFYFPSRTGSYEFNEIRIEGIAHRPAVRFIGNGGDVTELRYVGAGGASTPFIKIAGTDTSDFTGRMRYSGISGLRLTNASAATATTGLYLAHGTHHHYEDVTLQDWHRHGIYGSNLSDSWFDRVELDYCGSNDDANHAAVRWDGAQSSVWAGDANKWYGARFEVCGDRQIHLDSGCAKHVFQSCKFENSGGEAPYELGGTVTQFYIGTATGTVFSGCDFTLQDKRSGHAVIPSMFYVLGESSLMMSDCFWTIGSGTRPKCFTSLIAVDGSNTTAVLTNCIVAAGNTSSWPTQFVLATGTPIVGLKNVGWVGANRASGPSPLISGAVASLGA